MFLGRDGNRLAADAAGDPSNPPVVLLHGGGQTRHAWGTTLEALAAKGWRAYTVDLRGHGDSEWSPEGDYTIDAFAGDILAIIASLDQRPAIVGASLGGISSLAGLGESPAIDLARALILVDVAHQIEEDGRNRIGAFMSENMDTGFGSLDEVADAIHAYNPHRPRPSDLSGLMKNLRERNGRWYWHWDPRFIRARRNSATGSQDSLTDTDRLGNAAQRLRIPVQLVRGRMSDLLSEEGAAAFLALVPTAEMADVAGAGHMVAGDRNDLFNDAVVRFLEKVK